MSPEAKLAQHAERIHLRDEDVDYLLSLLQEARGLGSAAECEACLALVDACACEWRQGALCIEAETAEEIAKRLRARKTT